MAITATTLTVAVLCLCGMIFVNSVPQAESASTPTTSTTSSTGHSHSGVYGHSLVSLVVNQALQLGEVRSQLQHLKHQMETKTDKSETDNLKTQLETKTDKNETDSLKTQLETKTDKSETDSLKTQLETKTDSLKSETDSLKGELERQTDKVDDLERETKTVRSEVGANRVHLAELNRTHSAQGSHFVRWGRSTCPKDSTLVYPGYVAGTNQGHPGGGANYLCATRDPVYHDTPLINYGVLDGVEYYVTGHKYTDAQCAVCVTSRAVTYMVPGTDRCPDGSVAQYRGYLASDNIIAKSPAEYVCLDVNPEDRHGSEGNRDSGYLEHVKSHCGALPCPPYQEGKVVTCVVCSL